LIKQTSNSLFLMISTKRIYLILPHSMF